jgi:hypothetical protein
MRLVIPNTTPAQYAVHCELTLLYRRLRTADKWLSAIPYAVVPTGGAERCWHTEPQLSSGFWALNKSNRCKIHHWMPRSKYLAICILNCKLSSYQNRNNTGDNNIMTKYITAIIIKK